MNIYLLALLLGYATWLTTSELPSLALLLTILWALLALYTAREFFSPKNKLHRATLFLIDGLIFNVEYSSLVHTGCMEPFVYRLLRIEMDGEEITIGYIQSYALLELDAVRLSGYDMVLLDKEDTEMYMRGLL